MLTPRLPQLLMDLGDTAMLPIAQLTDHGDDIQPKLAMGQRGIPLPLLGDTADDTTDSPGCDSVAPPASVGPIPARSSGCAGHDRRPRAALHSSRTLGAVARGAPGVVRGDGDLV